MENRLATEAAVESITRSRTIGGQRPCYYTIKVIKYTICYRIWYNRVNGIIPHRMLTSDQRHKQNSGYLSSSRCLTEQDSYCDHFRYSLIKVVGFKTFYILGKNIMAIFFPILFQVDSCTFCCEFETAARHSYHKIKHCLVKYTL